MMKKILTALAAANALAGFIILAAPPTAALASACQGNGTGCTKAGSYTKKSVINSNYNGFNVVWTSSVVPSYSTIPSPWTVYITYTNVTSSALTLGCPGDWVNASYVWEELSGGSGDTGGGVAASSTTCSQNPGLNATVKPGHHYTTFATFGNVPWPGTEVAIMWGDAGTSPYIYPFGSGDVDWAGPSFCSSYSQPSLSYSNWGVTPCGQPFGNGSNNVQGKIKCSVASGCAAATGDKGFQFDSVGFQCVELAARYFLFETTLEPPQPQYAKDFVADLHSEYPQYMVSGNTDTFSSALTQGQIISMGDGMNDTSAGHVGVVTAVSVNSEGNGTITIMDENASATAEDTITVSGGELTTTTVGTFAVYDWTENLPY